MLHRCTYSLPWSSTTVGEPSDLPEILREDLLLVSPLDPRLLYVSWSISYATQNKLEAILNPKSLSQGVSLNDCRLVLQLTYNDDQKTSWEIDVSGPARSRIINLNPPHCSDERVVAISTVLGFKNQQDTFYAINRQGPTVLPRISLSSMESFYHRPKEQLYERIFRRIRPISAPRTAISDTKSIAQYIDNQLGRIHSPFEGRNSRG